MLAVGLCGLLFRMDFGENRRRARSTRLREGRSQNQPGGVDAADLFLQMQQQAALIAALTAQVQAMQAAGQTAAGGGIAASGTGGGTGSAGQPGGKIRRRGFVVGGPRRHGRSRISKPGLPSDPLDALDQTPSAAPVSRVVPTLSATSVVPGSTTPLPTIQRLKDLPKIGKDRDELPYFKWKVDARAYIDAAQLGAVLDKDPPNASSSPEWRAWFSHADAVVYAAILAAVGRVSILSDVIRRLQGQQGAAGKAWDAVHDHYVRLADTNQTYLMGKVRTLAPKEGENMEAFLNRCQALRDEFEAYNLQLDDNLLVTQVFSSLSHQWKQSCGLNQLSTAQISWQMASQLLQAEDNSRRQSNTEAEDALLPLGWTRRSKGGARQAEGRPKSSSDPSSHAHAAGGRKGDSGSSGGGGARDRTKDDRRGDKGSSLIVCYCCFKTGHGCGACPTKEEGWRLTPEAKAKADQIRRERMEQSSRDRAAANQAKGKKEEAGSSSASEGRTTHPSV